MSYGKLPNYRRSQRGVVAGLDQGARKPIENCIRYAAYRKCDGWQAMCRGFQSHHTKALHITLQFKHRKYVNIRGLIGRAEGGIIATPKETQMLFDTGNSSRRENAFALRPGPCMQRIARLITNHQKQHIGMVAGNFRQCFRHKLGQSFSPGESPHRQQQGALRKTAMLTKIPSRCGIQNGQIGSGMQYMRDAGTHPLTLCQLGRIGAIHQGQIAAPDERQP